MRGCSGGVCGCLGGHAWLLQVGVCVVALGVCALLLRGGHVWLLPGGMHGCSRRSVHGCSGGGMCGCSPGGHAWDTTRYGDTVNERAVRILLECILVIRIMKRTVKKYFS